MEKKMLGKAIAIGVCGLLVGGAVTYVAFPKTIETIKTVEKPVEVIKEVKVPVPYNVTQTKTIVDTKTVDALTKFIYEANEDKMSDILDDVDDDELYKIEGRAVFYVDTFNLAEKEVKEHAVSFLNKEDYFGDGVFEGFSKSDVTSIVIDETEIVDINFEDEQATVEVVAKVKLNDDGDRKIVNVRFTVDVDENSAEIDDAVVE